MIFNFVKFIIKKSQVIGTGLLSSRLYYKMCADRVADFNIIKHFHTPPNIHRNFHIAHTITPFIFIMKFPLN